jgi:hypothetical protein
MLDVTLPDIPGTANVQDHIEATIERKTAAHVNGAMEI